MAGILFNGAPGPQVVLVGNVVTLSDLDGFGGASKVLWELQRPLTSSSVLTKVGEVLVGPFTNDFTPDVPGNYLLRLTGYNAVGAVLYSVTGLAKIRVPTVPSFPTQSAYPAPGESTENDPSTGWAYEVEALLRDHAALLSGAEYATYANVSGGILVKGKLLYVDGGVDWPTFTGGVVVAGAPLDHLVSAEVGTGQQGRRIGLALNLADIANNATGRVLRRGMTTFDTAAWAPGVTLYYDPLLGGFTTDPRASFPVAYVVRQGPETGATAGLLYFDPINVGGLFSPDDLLVTLPDNTAVAADLSLRLQWTLAQLYTSAVVEYEVIRGGTPDIEVGLMRIVMNAAECIVDVWYADTTVSPGVFFGGVVAAGVAKVQFLTTNTGQDAFLRFRVLSERKG